MNNTPNNINYLHQKIREVILEARSSVSRVVNYAVIIQNWEIGRLIVEDEQQGEQHAKYGDYTIKELSLKLNEEFGKGYSSQQLKFCRQFYNLFPIGYALRSQLESAENESEKIGYALRGQSHPLFSIISPHLTWTHYRVLLKVENPKAREFYIKESVANNWGYRALERQVNSFYYERLLSSQDKKPVEDEMKEKTKSLTPEDVLKDPIVLDFLGIKENQKYLESELEQALIDKLNDFLLELGRGFAFVARQKRISTETKHFYIDLVFYNYLLKCFVLVDLKAGELTHQDIGQMDMYVRMFEDKVRADDDNPTIGLILCTKKDHAVVKYSVLNDSKQLFASKYQLYLPTEDELRKKLEAERQQIELELNLDKE